MPPKIAALFDGDEGGTSRRKRLEPLAKNFQIPVRQLPAGLTVEDVGVAAHRLMPDAVTAYISKLADRKPTSVKTSVQKSFEEAVKGEGFGLAKWGRYEGQKIAGTAEPLSAIGLAREYSLLVEAATDVTAEECKSALELAQWIREELALPSETLEQEAIVE